MDREGAPVKGPASLPAFGNLPADNQPDHTQPEKRTISRLWHGDAARLRHDRRYGGKDGQDCKGNAKHGGVT